MKGETVDVICIGVVNFKMVRVICEICGREITKCNYSKHIRRHKNNPNSFRNYSYALEHDGLNCQFCGKTCKNRNSLCNHERLCKENPNRQLTKYEKYGAIDGFNNVGRIAWNKGLTKYTDDRVKKYEDSETAHFLERGGTFSGKKHSEETKSRISSKMSEICAERNSSMCGQGKRGIYHNIPCQSSWELAYVIYQEEHGVNFVRNKRGFRYLFEGKEHTYFPDFYLPDCDTYVEIKGYYNEKTHAKVTQFEEKLLVMCYDSMKPILDYVIDKYGVDFTYLYDI